MKLRTLIIDDNSVIHFLHKEIVSDGGITDTPFTFLHGKTALQFLLNNQEADEAYFVLLDLNMPVMNGWQFLEELQKYPFSSRTFISIVSSSVDSEDKIRARQYPQVIGFFEKPFSEDDCEAVKQSDALKPFFS